ncbi:MAG: EAL domain-containing protein [Erysipelotrichaceae bacterium]|nr:EAL domain-containing protein [Erysipelotrichaceae bacterium]
MFHWLSNYDYDFALAAIPVQFILLFFYGLRRNLPIRQSVCFTTVMLSNLVMTIVDIIACELNELYMSVPVVYLYLANIIYFVSFIIRGWALFDYTVESCREYKILSKQSRLLTAIPAIIVLMLTLITPWAKTIFTYGPNGYENCILYRSIYLSTYFYIFASFICIFFCYNRLSIRTRTGLLLSNVLLLVGLVLRKMFYGIYLITSYVSILVILIIFLSMENPDLYRDHVIGLFNKDAFDLIGLDYLNKDLPFHCIIASVHNFESAKALYGVRQLIEALKKIGEKTIRRFPGYYVFYFGNGNFLLLKRGKIAEDRNYSIESWKDTFLTMHDVNFDDVSLYLNLMIMPYEMMQENIFQIDDLIDFAFYNSFVENQRGNYIVSKEMLKALQRGKDIEAALTMALENRTLEAHFQAIYSTEEDRIVGVETLARLIDPKMGYIPPDEFIGIAEKNGDIMELGRQVFELACIFCKKERLIERGIEFINVNLSPVQCLNEQLSFELSAIAEKYDIPLSVFDFEITESAADDYETIQRQMLLLQQKGAVISLDDFGTGTSNMTRLMKLPIHVVKLDMDITQSYFRGEADFVPDLIKMFQNAKMKIVVEGIETKEMKDKLSQLKCDYLQGFYFSKALPPEEFMAYYNSHKQG